MTCRIVLEGELTLMKGYRIIFLLIVYRRDKGMRWDLYQLASLRSDGEIIEISDPRESGQKLCNPEISREFCNQTLDLQQL